VGRAIECSGADGRTRCRGVRHPSVLARRVGQGASG